MEAPADYTKVNTGADLEIDDPSLYRAVQNVIGGLTTDIIPMDLQEAIFMALPAPSQRKLVAKIAGLDATVLVTLKSQLALMDSVLRRVVNNDGSPKFFHEDEDPGISMKDALNLSLRVSQVITRDLPKVYTVERVQKQEEALQRVMEKMLTPSQQAAFLTELENVENGK